jgi:hypothetical protein
MEGKEHRSFKADVLIDTAKPGTFQIGEFCVGQYFLRGVLIAARSMKHEINIFVEERNWRYWKELFTVGEGGLSVSERRQRSEMVLVIENCWTSVLFSIDAEGVKQGQAVYVSEEQVLLNIVEEEFMVNSFKLQHQQFGIYPARQMLTLGNKKRNNEVGSSIEERGPRVNLLVNMAEKGGIQPHYTGMVIEHSEELFYVGKLRACFGDAFLLCNSKTLLQKFLAEVAEKSDFAMRFGCSLLIQEIMVERRSDMDCFFLLKDRRRIFFKLIDPRKDDPADKRIPLSPYILNGMVEDPLSLFKKATSSLAISTISPAGSIKGPETFVKKKMAISQTSSIDEPSFSVEERITSKGAYSVRNLQTSSMRSSLVEGLQAPSTNVSQHQKNDKPKKFKFNACKSPFKWHTDLGPKPEMDACENFTANLPEFDSEKPSA